MQKLQSYGCSALLCSALLCSALLCSALLKIVSQLHSPRQHIYLNYKRKMPKNQGLCVFFHMFRLIIFVCFCFYVVYLTRFKYLEKLGNSHQMPKIDPPFVYFFRFCTFLSPFHAGFASQSYPLWKCKILVD